MHQLWLSEEACDEDRRLFDIEDALFGGFQVGAASHLIGSHPIAYEAEVIYKLLGASSQSNNSSSSREEFHPAYLMAFHS